MELGVEPGAYEVRIEIQKSSLLAKTQVDEGARVVLDPRQFGVTPCEATVRRGDDEPFRLAVDGRNRLEMRWGMWRRRRQMPARLRRGSRHRNLFNGLQYTRFLREDLAMTFGVQSVGAENGLTIGPQGVFAGTATIIASPLGLRWNPLGARSRADQPLKPFSPPRSVRYSARASAASSGGGASRAGESSQATVGGHIGGGVDFHLASRVFGRRQLRLQLDGRLHQAGRFAATTTAGRNSA